MKYLLIDTANTFFRARHIASKSSSLSEKISMAMHLTLNSVQTIFKKYGGDDTHVVFCLEGRSWRKDYYEPYKRNRSNKLAGLTKTEAEEDQAFWECYAEFCEFLKTKTNTSVLRNENAEADDLIARFIYLHPDDEHYIISSDGDFEQLLSSTVKQYNGITNQLITIDGVFDEKNKPVVDKKTGEPKTIGDIKFNLFEKCIRGDSGDNIFSAYPGVRTKGSSKKVGLTEAWAERDTKGFAWNNLMLQKWVEKKPIEDENGDYIQDEQGNYITEDVQHRVLDDYERNRKLIDLTCQPEEIKQDIDNTIRDNVRTTVVGGAGIHFMKFCGKHELIRISEQSDSFIRWLNRPYQGILKT